MSNIENAISLLTRISEIANNKNQGIGAPAEVGLAQEAIRLLEDAKVPTLQQHFAAVTAHRPKRTVLQSLGQCSCFFANCP
jgi:hypothetical protein